MKNLQKITVLFISLFALYACSNDEDSGSGSGMGQGKFTINGQTYSGLCAKTNSSFCTTGTGSSDATIAHNYGVNSFIVYNIPSESSGTFQFQDGYDAVTSCQLYALISLNTGETAMGTKAGGTLKKTGANSYTFSCSVYDIWTNQVYEVTGNGKY